MKVYVPFNTIVDIDFGVIRVIESVIGITEYPTNKLKSFLLNNILLSFAVVVHKR